MSSPRTGNDGTSADRREVVLDGAGAPAGIVTAQSGTTQAGVASLAGFSAVMRGNFVVSQAGDYQFNVTSQDGFLFGAGGGALRIGGVNFNAPANTPFASYPMMGANNGPSTGAAAPIVVRFPTPGSYPYEFDYRSGTAGALSLAVTVTQGTTTIGLRPLHSLVLTSNNPVTRPLGQQASFTLKVKDETGAPLAQFPVIVTAIAAYGTQTPLAATTDNTGSATVTYTGATPGADLVQASATINGIAAVSNQSTLTWVSSQAPLISVTGDQSLQLPNPGFYAATITDPSSGAGGAIAIQWTKVTGPGQVTFEAATNASTHAVFTAPGVYTLKITATNSLGGNFALLDNINVQAAVTISQGWIGSPPDGSHITGQTPITVAAGVTLTSGTLTYYPVANPSAVVTLNATTTGSGTLGTLDTTTLNNPRSGS